MSDVILSSAVRSNLLSLQNTADLMAKTQERLATGNKVNSALDNPTNFFTASSLNSRAGDLGRLLDSVANATQTLQAADNGISAITQLVESAQASARQALQVKGQQTTSIVTGSAGATFNPAALTTVNGDNSGSVPAGLTADAAADITTTGTFSADADITAISTVDLNGAAGVDTTTLDSLSAPGAALANGEQITISVNGSDFTVNFSNSGATSITGGNTLNVNITTETIANFAGNLNTLLGADVAVASDGTGGITFTPTSNVESIAFSDNDAGDAVLQKLGLDDTNANLVTDGANAAIATRNSEIEALISGGGGSLQVDFGGTTLGTVTFGTGAGQVASRDDLISTLNGFTGISASVNVGNTISIQATDSNDADSAIVLTSSNGAVQTAFNFDVSSALDSTVGLATTATANNLLTQGAVVAGEAIEVTVGDSPPLRVLFGNGTGEVSTIGELNTRLQSLSNGAASVDARGEINITANNAGDSVTVGGDTNALTSFGLTAGETNSLIDGTNIALGDKLNIQVGTNTTLNIVFGTGAGQVNTLNELTEALGNLAGGTATIDNTTGAITIEARQGTDNITVSGTNAADVDKPSVRSAFGLPSSGVSTTTDSTERASLRSQYNELLTQVDELAEDAGFNGVNLLNGDNLKVIFNEDGSSKLDITGVRFDSSSLGISRASSGYFQSDSNIEATLSTLDTVIGNLRSQASQFGSNLSVVETRENFTTSMINTLETGAANLTLADTNEEGANLLALQTRQQLSSTALSLASQADQNVLRLF